MTARKHIALKTKLAAALRELFQVPYEHAKLMTEDQILSLATYDHGILHGVKPVDDHWNLTPRMIVAHREKSRRDTATVAKVKRVERKGDDHARRMILKGVGPKSPLRKLKLYRWPARPIPSRQFQKRRRRCNGCWSNFADPPSVLCAGCQAYQEHQR